MGRLCKYQIGQRLQNRLGYWYTILGCLYENIYKIKFDSGYEKEVQSNKIRYGNIKDKYSPSVCGVGIIGDVENVINHYLYSRWCNMIYRCYNLDYPNYGDKGVTVGEQWHWFENFIKDAEKLPGFDKDRIVSGELQLDKDILGDGSCYCRKDCCWVTQGENNTEAWKTRKINDK